jgi:hypothetical protein
VRTSLEAIAGRESNRGGAAFVIYECIITVLITNVAPHKDSTGLESSGFRPGLPLIVAMIFTLQRLAVFILVCGFTAIESQSTSNAGVNNDSNRGLHEVVESVKELARELSNLRSIMHSKQELQVSPIYERIAPGRAPRYDWSATHVVLT